jgi:predicted RNA-binding Zn-ribbon protein involved in translation (DUF1610 family)
MQLRMKEQTVYYCWSCDAHRVGMPSNTAAVCCPRCGNELPAEARIEKTADSAARSVSRLHPVLTPLFALPN